MQGGSPLREEIDVPVKNPLTPDHYKMLDQVGRQLAEYASYSSKLKGCGEDCQEMDEVARELEEKRNAILREFPRPNSPA